jgi:diguanylate cyclase (GGDEF)-like protein
VRKAAAAPPSTAVDALLAGLPGAVYRCEAVHGRPIVFVAGSATEVLGPAGASPAVGTPLDDWVHPDDRPEVVGALAALTAGAPFSLEYRLNASDGERWVQDRGRATAAAGRLWIDGVLVDATPERMVRQELARLALHDPLTGLPNRRAGTARATKALMGAAEEAAPVSVVVLDIDHFKRVNDTFGRGAGDRVLVELAQSLRERCPEGGMLARLGGEEFALLAPGVARGGLREAAERVLGAGATIALDAFGSISLSAGAVTWARGEDVEALLARADRVLYRAQGGRAGPGRARLSGAAPGRGALVEWRAMEIRARDEAVPFTTADGSTIRSLLDRSNAPVANHSLAEASLPPGGATQRHHHRVSEEFYFLVEGEGVMEIDGETRAVGPGDTVLIPPGTRHQITAGDAGLRFLCTCAPPYSHEDTYLD